MKKIKILFVSGYNSWDQISGGFKPSHHLFGIHEFIDHYEFRDDGTLYGIIKENIIEGVESGEVDFYIWKSVKNDILKHIRFMLSIGNKYDLIYDCLNRCSIYLGIVKRLGLFRPKVITVLHHPWSYRITLQLSNSEAYIFFNDEYREIAEKVCHTKKNLYFVNEWYPDSAWYRDIAGTEDCNDEGIFYIDNGQTERDRDLLIRSANESKIRIDYAGKVDEQDGFAREYRVNLNSYVDITRKLKTYKCIVIPIRFFKSKIGPFGITSFMDCMALGIPVITSDNTCFAADVKKYDLGLIYETGNCDDFKRCLVDLLNNEGHYHNCCENMITYSTKRTITSYSESLKQIIRFVINSF